jgi:hypothetical protein
MTLNDLLAVIHGDGGHYTNEVGLERSIVDAASKITAIRRLLHEVACAGVELEDPRMSYVVVQIDVAVWKTIKEMV